MQGIRRVVQNLGITLCIGFAIVGLTTSCASLVQGVTSSVLDRVLQDKPPQLEAQMVASPELNPDYRGQASPLVVRFYELTNITDFNAASFFALYDQDVQLLGEELKNREEFVLLPGDTKEFNRELNMDTRYVGIIGAYRDIEKVTWRVSIETPKNNTIKTTIDFTRQGIVVIPKTEK